MDAAPAELIVLLNEATTGFRLEGDTFSANRLQDLAQRIEQGDFLGLTSLLLCFGNMGNMDDTAPDALASLLDDIFERTRALIRVQEEKLAALSSADQAAIRARLSPDYHSIWLIMYSNRQRKAFCPKRRTDESSAWPVANRKSACRMASIQTHVSAKPCVDRRPLRPEPASTRWSWGFHAFILADLLSLQSFDEPARRGLLSQESQALSERVEALSEPGAKEAGQAHAGLTALGRARSPADFASDDQRTHTALGEVVVGGYAREGDKSKHFWQKPLHPLAQDMVKRLGMSKGLAECPEPLFKGVLLCPALLLLFAC